MLFIYFYFSHRTFYINIEDNKCKEKYMLFILCLKKHRLNNFEEAFVEMVAILKNFKIKSYFSLVQLVQINFKYVRNNKTMQT